MILLPGNSIADKILIDLREKIAKSDSSPVFAAVLVGDDPASHIYVSLKEKAAASVGIEFRKIILPETISQGDLLAEIQALNADASVSGVLVQLPLPEHFDTQSVVDALDPKKDVDGFHPENSRLFLEGKDCLEPVFPRAIMELMQSAKKDLPGKRAIVIGNSDIFGQLLSAMLARENINAEFVRHNKLACLSANVLAADIVVTACGIPNLIKGDMVKDGAIVIDGGITQVGDKVVGDVDKKSMESRNVFLSPVPGGVGPVTIACLLDNVYKASHRNL